MKKVLVLLTFFFFIPIIHANDNIGCIYEVENCRVTFMVKSKKNEKKGTVDVNIYSNGQDLKFITKNVKAYSNFYKNGKLSCPKSIYSKVTNNGVTLNFKKVNSSYQKSELNKNTSVEAVVPDSTVPEIPPTDWGTIEDTNLETICAKPELRKPLKFIGTLVNVLKIGIPILILVLGIVDLFKAIPSSKDDRIMVAVKSIGVRFIAGVCIFFIPGIVQLLLDWVNEWSSYENTWCCCTQCILDANNCDVNSCSSDSCKIGGMN